MRRARSLVLKPNLCKFGGVVMHVKAIRRKTLTVFRGIYEKGFSKRASAADRQAFRALHGGISSLLEMQRPGSGGFYFRGRDI